MANIGPALPNIRGRELPKGRPPRGGLSIAGAPVVQCRETVTVKIHTVFDVACPGHQFEMTAVGNPGGGSYLWRVSGAGARLVDQAEHESTSLPHLFLWSFQPDNNTGKIPERVATVAVTYRYRGQSASDTLRVPIHAIDFNVTDARVTAGVTEAWEDDERFGVGGVVLAEHEGIATISTDPRVKIVLNGSCPRPNECARVYWAGWLQTAYSNTRQARYHHALREVIVNQLPMRDGDEGRAPFYDPDARSQFTNDGDTQTVHHDDCPKQSAFWEWPPGTGNTLREVHFSHRFRAWLVVENVEWALHCVEGCDDYLVYLRHFDWSLDLRVAVDTRRPVGQRCSRSPQSTCPRITVWDAGKGSLAPVLVDPTLNSIIEDPQNTTVRQLRPPAPPPPRRLRRNAK